MLHTGSIGDAGNDGLAWDIRIVLVHEESNIVHRGLCLIYQNQTGWMVNGNLLHHLGTDTSCCTCNENGATIEELADGIHIYLNLISWQEVFDIHLTHHLMTDV